MRLVLFQVFLFLIYQPLFAQRGQLPINNYSPKQYGMHSSSNWGIAQDHLGIMYFGNANGVLQFDGRTWQFIPVKYGTYVRTITSDNKGRIYVGCYGEFGYLESDANGKMKYFSISSSLGNIDEKFKDIIKIHVVENRVYFQSEERIYIYSGGVTLQSVLPETSFHTSFKVDNKLFVRQRSKGLYELKGRELIFIPGSGIFADKGIFSMLGLDHQRMLILTHESGLYQMESSKGSVVFSKFKVQENVFPETAKIYGGINLHDGNIAINSLTSGILIMDNVGNTITRLNKLTGIADDDVKELFQDKHNNLWLTTNNGISMIVWTTPITYFNAGSGLEGSVHDILKHDHRLYVATSNGLFCSDSVSSNRFYFKRVENTSRNQYWEIRFENNSLIASGIDGLYVINNNNARRVYENSCRSAAFDPDNKVWLVGGESGLTLLEEDWKVIRQIEDLNIVIIKIVKEQLHHEHRFWISSLQYGLSYLSLDIALNAKVQYLGFPKGAENEYIYPFTYHEEILFGTTQGIFSFKNDAFSLSAYFNDKTIFKNVSMFRQAGNKIWMVNNNRLQIYYPYEKSFTEAPFKALNNGQIYCVFSEHSHTWIGSHEGLIRYEHQDKKNYKESYPILIRMIKTKDDSVLYFGNQMGFSQKNKLPFRLNSLNIEYAALFFEESPRTEYSTFLDGYDKNWTTWNKENKVNYANLPEGNYQFFVKARNVYETQTREAVFSFTILPPWYRTLWAYLLYTLTGIISFFAFIRWRERNLKARQKDLEIKVEEATVVIRKQRDEVEKQKEIAEHRKEEVEEKNREILDSINYAKRIQTAILPPARVVKGFFNDSFVLYLPKDIVAGDFYWMEGKEDSVYFAACDCTGHGVPGAMVSVVCNTALNRSLHEFELREPGKIFDKTRELVLDNFVRSDEEVKDGMDAVLCALNLKTKQLFWSGANRPIWIYRKATREMEEKKADKQPIGMGYGNWPFSTHSLTLNEGDAIYIFTDGYADQFGGEKGKKLTIARFREFLLSIVHLPMEQQREELLRYHLDWRGQGEQVDDICIIGVRVSLFESIFNNF
jgi:serine phosphatase RsbU (regulator of sigma subunit)